jgi:Caspase domain
MKNMYFRSGLSRMASMGALTTALLAAGLPLRAQAPGDLRVALVIGNAAYAGNAALTNPGNDAKAMSDTLRGLGFTVVEVRDGSKAQMAEAIANVKTTLQGKHKAWACSITQATLCSLIGATTCCQSTPS